MWWYSKKDSHHNYGLLNIADTQRASSQGSRKIFTTRTTSYLYYRKIVITGRYVLNFNMEYKIINFYFYLVIHNSKASPCCPTANKASTEGIYTTFEKKKLHTVRNSTVLIQQYLERYSSLTDK